MDVSATELSHRSSELLARVRSGARLVIYFHGKPVAALVPLDDLRRLEADGPPAPVPVFRCDEGQDEREQDGRVTFDEIALPPADDKP